MGRLQSMGLCIRMGQRDNEERELNIRREEANQKGLHWPTNRSNKIATR